jgi:cruciform cutting endonuclease 1
VDKLFNIFWCDNTLLDNHNLFSPLMAPKPRPVTAKALQALLTRIGSASSGTKDVLHRRFKRDLVGPQFFAESSEWEARQDIAKKDNLRILSIDMGIKNLAYCRAEVDYPDGHTSNPTMAIVDWNKLNLVDATRDLLQTAPHPHMAKEDSVDADESLDPYSLDKLSETAYRFVTETVLTGAPDVILIERQRWRSSNSSAIQQWTVRVNTLEAMLWATLRTILLENMRRDYEIYGVDPKRVGQYWLEQYAQAKEEKDGALLALDELEEGGVKKASSKKLPRNKVEKKAKIALLRRWLSAEPASTASTTPASAPTINFIVEHGAIAAQRSLLLSRPTRSKKKTTTDTNDGADEAGVQEDGMKKLDDITDCFLQAAAWVAWESNKLQLCEVWKKEQGDISNMPNMDEATLREMVELVGIK